MRKRLDEYGNEYDDPTDEESPPGTPAPTPPPWNLSGDTRDRPVDERAERERQARDLNARLGLKDTGNLESFLSGRASWDEYQKDEAARAGNRTFSGGGSGGDADVNADRRADAGWTQNAGGQWVKTGGGTTTTPATTGTPGTAKSAYTQYLTGGSPATTGVSTTQPVSVAATASPPPDPLMAQLLTRLKADQDRQEAERAQLRQIVMSQLGDATTPVSETSPGIKPVIDAEKLALQRGADRQRSAAAERAAYQHLGPNGGLDTRINQIEQGRGEAEAGMIGRIMQNELQAKRGQVAQLLDLAVRSGDTEAARTLQGQLQTLEQQMTQSRFASDLGFRNRTFDEDLGFRNRALDTQTDLTRDDLGFRRYAFDTGQASNRYQFDNDLAYRLAQLQLMGNQNAMGFLGGLL